METGPTDCEYMYRAILHPNVMQKFLKNPDGMIELVKSFARDELDVYDEIDISKNPELRQDGKVVVVTGAGRGIGQVGASQALCDYELTKSAAIGYRIDVRESKRTSCMYLFKNSCGTARDETND